MLPLLYEDPVLLQEDQHQNAALVANDSYAFATSAYAVPLNISEFALAARFYPIVFADTEAMLPLAVTGLSEHSNLFIDGDGRWADGIYVPAYVRRYPFLPVTTPGNDAIMLAIDRPRLAPDGDAVDANRLFENGKPAPLAQRALEFCERYHRDHLLTTAFVSALAAHDLLETRHADIHLPDQSKFRVDGFRMIARARLRALDDSQLAAWFRKGWLDLAALAEVSQANWQTLLDRHVARCAATQTQPTQQKPSRKRANA